MDENLKIVVVYGGISTEREVSLKSGNAVCKGLLEYGYKNVELFDLREDNLSELIAKKPDIAYLALHGKGGEDGCIQGALELAGIAYTGPGVESSAVCMNKILTKQVLQSYGLPTAKFSVIRKDELGDIEKISESLVSEIGLPMVLKSPCQGSSIGVVLVKSKEQMLEAINEIYSYGDFLLAETFVDGVELTLPIFGNDELTVLSDIEITSENEFYDYKAKYTQGLCHHIIPARISDELHREVAEVGKRAYKALNCCGLSRIDFIVDKNKGPMIIEVNTLPGMTEMSLFPDAARAGGISFSELVAKILELGLNAKR